MEHNELIEIEDIEKTLIENENILTYFKNCYKETGSVYTLLNLKKQRIMVKALKYYLKKLAGENNKKGE